MLCKRIGLHTVWKMVWNAWVCFMLQQRPKLSIVMGTSRVISVSFLFLFMKITKTFITCLSDSLTWPVVCLRALSSLTCKIMRVIFQERPRDQENNRNVFERVPLLSCVWRAATGSNVFLLCFLLLFSNAYNKNISLFLRKLVYIVTLFPGDFDINACLFGESCERTVGRNSRNFELLQGEMFTVFQMAQVRLGYF